MKIIKANKEDQKTCFEIAKEHPHHFNKTGLKQMKRDLKSHEIYIARKDNEIVGFISITRKNKEVAEISWMAVRKEKQKTGIGTKLIEFICGELRKRGFALLEVKTLDKSVKDKGYTITRKFYEAMGFIHVETIEKYEPWEEGSPCAIYIKIL